MHKSNMGDSLMTIAAVFSGGGISNGHDNRQACTGKQYLFLFGSSLLVLL